MRRTRTLSLAVLLAGASLAMPALAECVYPKTPASAPNGDTATKEEMLAGRDAITKYNTDIEAYLECLDQETKTSSEAAADDAARKKIKEISDRKHDAAVGELRARADDFNKQLRAYNAKRAKS